MTENFKNFFLNFRRKTNIGIVYILTNFNSTIEEDLYRIYTTRDLGFNPFVMIYDKQHSDKQHRRLQRWCNNKIIFNKTKTFEEYIG